MNKELVTRLYNRFPFILCDLYGDPRQTCMAWGIECGDGWYEILDKLFEDITVVCAGTNKEFRATQIKEKFGGLRIYYAINNTGPTYMDEARQKMMTFMFRKNQGKLYWKLWRMKQKIKKSVESKIDDLIIEAESKSFRTCEQCGQPARVCQTDFGWYRTLCDSCRVQKLGGQK